MDGVFLGVYWLGVHRIRLEASLGWSPIWHIWACSPSDLIERVDGCSEFEHFWAGIPSVMAEDVIRCRVCARQALHTPSDKAET